MKTKLFKALERVEGHEIPRARAHEVWDPVCGTFLAQSALRFTYEGRSFPFCSFPCASRFREDPECFLRGAAPAMMSAMWETEPKPHPAKEL